VLSTTATIVVSNTNTASTTFTPGSGTIEWYNITTPTTLPAGPTYISAFYVSGSKTPVPIQATSFNIPIPTPTPTPTPTATVGSGQLH